MLVVDAFIWHNKHNNVCTLDNESQEALYGYEPWRLEKLRRLKSEFDLEGRFGTYNLIP